jgi:curved DNA-binding protein CbpA
MTHYEFLGVARTAGPDEIVKAYRAKARLLHPDVNKSPNAHTEFKQLSEAYTTLIDPNKRAIYNAKLPPEPKPVPPKPKGPPRDAKGNLDYSKDPNLGKSTIIDVPPRKFDVWGQPWDEPNFRDSVRYGVDLDTGMPILR